MSSLGYGSLGFGVVLKQKQGLRPEEFLRLCLEHVMFNDMPSSDQSQAKVVMGLGARGGIKAKGG